MAARWAGAAAGIVGGQVLGRALSAFLTSDTGERVIQALDSRPLTPLERRVLARKWSGAIGKAISGAIALLFLTQSGEKGRRAGNYLRAVRQNVAGGPTEREIDWVQVLQRGAEIMLAVGAILRVVGEFLEERQRTAEEHERDAAKHLV